MVRFVPTPFCASLVLCYCDKTLTKTNLRKKVFIWLCSYSSSLREVSTGTMKESTIVAYYPWLAHGKPYIVHAHLPGDGTAHSR